MIKNSLRNNITKNFKYGLVGVFVALLIHLISKELDFLLELIVAGFFIGFFIREIEVTLSKTRLRKLNFKRQIILRPVVYSSVALIIIIGIVLIKVSINENCTIIEAIGEKGFWNYLFFTNFYLVVILILTVSLLVSFIWQVNLLLGPGVLMKFVAGKYEKPQKEKKIFMFMDLNSSVRMGEILGTEKYSDLLKDFFLELTNPLQKYKGEIYQYVGDEVVVAWDKEIGVKKNNALKFVFSVIKRIKKQRQYYIEKYGLIPEFKVGMHYGETIVREVGELKKEIVYHGDLLNTTSRIRSICNKLNRQVLISKEFYSILENNNEFTFESMGEVELKGKKESVYLYSVKVK